MCVLSDHQPANHQEKELSVTRESSVNTEKSNEHCAQGITSGFVDVRTQRNCKNSNTVLFEKQNGHCAQPIISEFEGARTQRNCKNSNTVLFEKQNGHCAQPFLSEFEGARTQRTSPDSNTVEFDRPNKHCAQSIISQFDDARTQKVSSELNTVVIRAEIHAEDTDAQHIVHFEEAEDFSDTGSLITQAPQSQSIHATINALSSWVSAIQPRESWYLAGWISDSPIEFLVDPGAVVSAISLQSYEKLMEANAILTPMKAIHMELEAANKSDMSVHGMCNCHAILGMDILGDASKLPFILDLVGGTLSGGGYETIQLHRYQAATECFAETTDSVCIPPHSALQTFVQEFGLLVGRSLVRADAEDWKIPVLIYHSDPCTNPCTTQL